jgi:large subunit ribosomal protein L22
MIGKATVRYIRISPRKVRQVIDLIRGRGCVEAMATLDHLNKRAAKLVYQLLHSAIKNVENKAGHTVEQLYISKVTADRGPSLKRFRARAMGRAAQILKRMSHIQVELDLVPGTKTVAQPDKPAGRLQALGQRLKKKKKAATAAKS